MSMVTVSDIERDPVIQGMTVLKLGVPGHRTMTVEYRGDSLWAVCDFGTCLTNYGEWVYEPLPSNRSDDFIASTRFTLHEAVAKAIAKAELRP